MTKINRILNNILLASALSLGGISNSYTQTNKPQEIFPLEKTLTITPSEYMYNVGKEPKNLKDYKLVNVIGNPNCAFLKNNLPNGVEAIVMTKEIYGNKLVKGNGFNYYWNGNTKKTKYNYEFDMPSIIIIECKGIAVVPKNKK